MWLIPKIKVLEIKRVYLEKGNEISQHHLNNILTHSFLTPKLGLNSLKASDIWLVHFKKDRGYPVNKVRPRLTCPTWAWKSLLKLSICVLQTATGHQWSFCFPILKEGKVIIASFIKITNSGKGTRKRQLLQREPYQRHWLRPFLRFFAARTCSFIVKDYYFLAKLTIFIP